MTTTWPESLPPPPPHGLRLLPRVPGFHSHSYFLCLFLVHLLDIFLLIRFPQFYCTYPCVCSCSSMRNLLDFPLEILKNMRNCDCFLFYYWWNDFSHMQKTDRNLFLSNLDNYKNIGLWMNTMIRRIKTKWYNEFVFFFCATKIRSQTDDVSWEMQTNRMNLFDVWNLGQTVWPMHTEQPEQQRIKK